MNHLIGNNTIILPKGPKKEKDRAVFTLDVIDKDDLTIDATFKEPTIIASKQWVKNNMEQIKDWCNKQI